MKQNVTEWLLVVPVRLQATLTLKTNYFWITHRHKANRTERSRLPLSTGRQCGARARATAFRWQYVFNVLGKWPEVAWRCVRPMADVLLPLLLPLTDGALSVGTTREVRKTTGRQSVSDGKRFVACAEILERVNGRTDRCVVFVRNGLLFMPWPALVSCGFVAHLSCVCRIECCEWVVCSHTECSKQEHSSRATKNDNILDVDPIMHTQVIPRRQAWSATFTYTDRAPAHSLEQVDKDHRARWRTPEEGKKETNDDMVVMLCVFLVHILYSSTKLYGPTLFVYAFE